MPPKRTSSLSGSRGGRRGGGNGPLAAAPSVKEKQALSNMFKRIESSDQTLIKCTKCELMVKSCLMKDHLETKCENRLSDEQIKQELQEIRTQQVQTKKR